MKKGLFSLTLILLLSLTACGSANTTNLASADTNSAQNTELQKNSSAKPLNEPSSVSIGETVLINDVAEFTVESADVTKDVLPPEPAEYFYTHYEAENGKAYVNLCVAYKNLSTSDISVDRTLSGKLLYADKYEYTGFSIVEQNNRSDFTYSNITNIAPLSTEYVHYLFEVPEEVQNSSDSITLKMTIGGQKYQITVR